MSLVGGTAARKRQGEASLQLPDLVDALSALSGEDRKVRSASLVTPSGMTLGRIESRITEAMAASPTDEDPIDSDMGPDMAHVDPGSLDILDPAWETTFNELVSHYDAEPDQSPKTRVAPKLRSRISRKMRVMAAVLAGTTLVAAALVGGSAGALPGDRLYSVKLQVESVRLGIAGSPMAKADLLTQFFSDRLDGLRSVGAASAVVPGLLAELDSTSIAALEILQAAEAGPRRSEVARDLNGLARSEQHLISDFMQDAPRSSIKALNASLIVSSMVVMSTERLLDSRGASHSDPRAWEIAPSLDALPPAQEIGPASDRTHRAAEPRARQIAPAPGSDTRTGSPDSPSTTPPTDTDPDCSVTAGSVCFRVPTVPNVPGMPL